MLENEPQGGVQDGAVAPSDDATTGTSPVRRVRAPRRKAVAPSAETPLDAPSGEQAAAGANEVAGEPAPGPVKASRSRRKATAPAAVPSAADSPPADGTAPASDRVDDRSADGDSMSAEPAVAPVKAARTRRKKAVPAAAALEPPVEAPTTEVDEDEPVAPFTRAVPVVGVLSLDEAFVVESPAERVPPRRTALPPAVLFMPPDPTEVTAVPPARRSRRGTTAPASTAPATTAATSSAANGSADAAPTGEVTAVTPAAQTSAEVAPVEAAAPIVDEAAPPPRRSRRRGTARVEVAEPVSFDEVADAIVEAPVAEGTFDDVDEVDETADDIEDEAEDDEDFSGARRRRRRGRRGRGRGKGPTDEGDDAEGDEPEDAEASAEQEAEDDEEVEDGDLGDGVTRRRRRRRRKGATGEAETGGIEDGVHTVVRVREPRRTTDEVQGVSGSTRLEAKRQRRRDGREQRRTRPPILSESEFLARREAVDRVMVVRQKPDRIQIVVLEDGVLVEHYVSRTTSGTMVGNVYLGKVQNVLPSMEAAFIDVGRGRNAVLYAGEVNWDATGLEGRARSIEQALRSGDSVLVQVTKDPIGHKGARLSSHIALSGRHLVYVPNGNASGISRKLPDNERKRLRDALKKLVPDGAGVIVRTAAEGASEEELERDVTRLRAQWEEIQAKAAEVQAPAALSEEPDLVIRVVRDLFNEDFRELIVQGEQAFGELQYYLNSVSPDLVERMHRYVGTGDVFADQRIDEQILKGLDRKVFLPSGGHLVFDRTEAMTVVDVNTGKYTGAGGNLEETVTRNNLEAAEEIVRQLRLRDIGGIVVIDFIDMVLESNRELVLRRLTECLGRDRTKHQVTEITSLGLVQMTRKRIGAGLLEAFSETCDHCKGRGVILHTEPVAEKRPNGVIGNGAAVVTQVKAVAAAVRTELPAQPPVVTKSRRRRGGGGGEVETPANTEISSEHLVEVVVVTDDVVTGPAAIAAELPPTVGSGVVAMSLRPILATDNDDYDITGYDLSRYEADESRYEADEPAESPSTVEPQPVAEPLRLTGADDPDALDEDEDDEEDGDEPVGAGAGGRRRSRRGGTRRRTRP